ncbi:hypothetical protein HMPREF9622_00705 [Cutibacterium modestum HL037PA3]|uniref:Uncharacterized protein n=1 Tax=Cutibacterium modestum HL044PA1 TaxID=765109 RepID=A0ABP2K516_9ACTN|nr:hypothetical protein HMPREF9621_01281 [Cutibacterium modestum HL037PA2]EFS91986.1 hypothetical protein HMPREF9607_01852 [Cutibacterium modestum HL044PA1]EFT16251.1 hypothetical protein HMPREF9622_00705 [Cutibacterium modestum HL037PA3]EGG27743.1 hypothetical protein PA08_0430 [Cutibacterium modestum P08]
MGQVFFTARWVGTGGELGGNRLPLRTTVPGIAAGHLPLRDGHDFLLGVLGVGTRTRRLPMKTFRTDPSHPR